MLTAIAALVLAQSGSSLPAERPLTFKVQFVAFKELVDWSKQNKSFKATEEKDDRLPSWIGIVDGNSRIFLRTVSGVESPDNGEFTVFSSPMIRTLAGMDSQISQGSPDGYMTLRVNATPNPDNPKIMDVKLSYDPSRMDPGSERAFAFSRQIQAAVGQTMVLGFRPDRAYNDMQAISIEVRPDIGG